jgi:hypothetical protein
MMGYRMMRYRVLGLVLGAALVLASPGTGLTEPTMPEMAELIYLISENDDPYMTASDLAFFLATHSYDATPKEGYVLVRLGKNAYRLIPNGLQPGLAEIALI